MMHKIVVFSDSHGTSLPMEDVTAEEDPDQIIFLGDGWSDSETLSMAFPQIPMIRVPGNCDYQPYEECEQLVELYGKRIFLCHGHTLRVKNGPEALIARGHRFGADIALYGHTHRPYCSMEGSMWVMNPGPMNRYDRKSYGLITIDRDGKTYCQIRLYGNAAH